MKYWIVIIGLLFVGTVQAQNYDLAMGIRGGVPGGFTAKKMIDDFHGFEILLGTEFQKRMNLTALYEYHGYIDDNINWYGGLGGSINFGEGTGFRTDAIAGLEYTSFRFPLNLSVDWKPLYSISTEEFIADRFAISIRFIFHR